MRVTTSERWARFVIAGSYHPANKAGVRARARFNFCIGLGLAGLFAAWGYGLDGYLGAFLVVVSGYCLVNALSAWTIGGYQRLFVRRESDIEKLRARLDGGPMETSGPIEDRDQTECVDEKGVTYSERRACQSVTGRNHPVTGTRSPARTTFDAIVLLLGAAVFAVWGYRDGGYLDAFLLIVCGYYVACAVGMWKWDGYRRVLARQEREIERLRAQIAAGDKVSDRASG